MAYSDFMLHDTVIAILTEYGHPMTVGEIVRRLRSQYHVETSVRSISMKLLVFGNVWIRRNTKTAGGTQWSTTQFPGSRFITNDPARRIIPKGAAKPARPKVEIGPHGGRVVRLLDKPTQRGKNDSCGQGCVSRHPFRNSTLERI